MKKNQSAIHSIKKPVDLAKERPPQQELPQSPMSKAVRSTAAQGLRGSPPEGFEPSGAEDVPSFTGVGSRFDAEAEIAILAQRYYREEGCPSDRAVDHWLRAEREVRGAQHCQGRDPESLTETAMLLGQ